MVPELVFWLALAGLWLAGAAIGFFAGYFYGVTTAWEVLVGKRSK